MNICLKCQSETHQIKYGYNKSGTQRYKCRSCQRVYTLVRQHTVSFRSLEQAGFKHVGLLEIDHHACQTLRLNRPKWNVIQSDVKTFNATSYYGIDLLAGGIPCPPFSVAGKQLGEDDERNLFEDVLRLTAQSCPKAVMIENVRGLLDPRFSTYRSSVSDRLVNLGYAVFWHLVHASDYGVPQLRPRTVMVAIQQEYAPYFRWMEPKQHPAPTVGEVLAAELGKNGWAGVTALVQKANTIAPTLVGGSKKHGGADLGPTRAKKAWAQLGIDGRGIADAPPSPDFDGMPRLTLRMTAILQGFPIDWQFVGKKTASYRQIGNAFPPPVAKAVGEMIIKALRKLPLDIKE
jgi:DNA (cytosine-5)-methyltransferase 1